MVESIQGVYFSAEDKYYQFLDWLDSKGIPVYSVVEPIDKVLPSFVLFLLFIVALIGLGIWWVMGNLLVSNVNLIVEVKDTQNSPLPGITVQLAVGDRNLSKATNQVGKTDAFVIPRGSQVKIVIERQGFQRFESELFRVNENQIRPVTLVPSGTDGGGPPGGQAIPRKIRLVDSQANLVQGREITLTFSCMDHRVTPPAPITTTTGMVDVPEPAGCGGLQARITSATFVTIDSRAITGTVANAQTIFLTEVTTQIEKGNVQVTVVEDEVPVEEELVVELWDGQGLVRLTQSVTSEGVVLFENLDPGTYQVKTVATAEIASVRETGIQVVSNQTALVTLEIERSVQGSIRIKVVARNTQTVIENATVVLQQNREEVGREVTSRDNNGEVIFYLDDDVAYAATVDAEGFCLATRDNLRLSPGRYVIDLEPFTAACGGSLIAQVIDQDGKPVVNALVALANEQRFLLGIPHKTTDLNGMVTFDGIPPGTYSAFAYKGTISGWSDPSFFNRRRGEEEGVDLTVTMQIPNGTLNVTVVDKEGIPIPFATVFFMDVSTNEAFGSGPRLTEGNGTLVFEERADKKVFLVVQKEGFASFVSKEYAVLPSTIQNIQVELLPEVTRFEVELLGLYQGNFAAPPSEDASVSLANGQEYIARFRVKIPKENATGNRRASEIGLHVRTGDDVIVEKDLLFLKETNVPQAAVVRGTSFSNDFQTDSRSITNGDAKWINVVWGNALGSVLEAEVVVSVKPSVAAGERLSIWYRGWMRAPNGTTLDPVDNSDASHELYADAKLARYLVGAGTLCDERFCFEASVFDPATQLTHPLENQGFVARTLHDYVLTFSIANISPRDLDTFSNTELRIRNPQKTLLLKNYSIDATNLGGTVINGTANRDQLPNMPLGSLIPGRQFAGTLQVFSQKPRDGTLVIEVVDTDRHEIVFSREINVQVEAQKQLTITVQPADLIAGIENTVVFTVTDQETTEPIERVTVTVRDRFDHILLSALTNSQGNVEMILPGQAPGEKLVGVAEKPDYNQARVAINVDSRIATVSPTSLGYSLNPQTKPTETKTITISNISRFPLEIGDIRLEGRFFSLLNEEGSENALAAFKGRVIQPNEVVDIPVPIILSTNARSLTEPASLNGTVMVDLTNFGRVWSYEVKTAISIGLGGEVDDPTCLSVSPKEWITSTEGRPVALRAQLQNNCSVNGIPSRLQEVEAKLVWETNPSGDFTIASTQSHADLRTGYFKTILPSMNPEQSETVTITFTPDGLVTGESTAVISFQATNPTDSKPQVVSADLHVKVQVVNLLECISISKTSLQMTSEWVFAPQTTGFGQQYNKQLYEGEFEDTDFSGQLAPLTNPLGGFTGTNPYFNNGVYNGYNPTGFNYGLQPGFSPALGGTGFNGMFGQPTLPTTTLPGAMPNPLTGRQLLGIGMPGTVATAPPVPSDSFIVETKNCGGPVTVSLESLLHLSVPEVRLGPTEKSPPIVVTGEEKYPGQYGIKLSIQGAGSKTLRPFRYLPVVLFSNPFDCIQMNKFEFNVFKEGENQGIDTARVFNYCLDKPVPVLVDQHNLKEALKQGQKSAALGFAMGLLSEAFKGDIWSKLKTPDKEKEVEEEEEDKDVDKTVCTNLPSDGECKGNQFVAIRQADGSYSNSVVPVYKYNGEYYYNKGTTPVKLEKKDGQYREPAPTTPSAAPRDGNLLNNPDAFNTPTGFQIFGLPYSQQDSFEQTGNERIDARRREDAQELADIQMLPIAVSMIGGGKDPFSMALMMYAMGSVQAYNAQEDVRLLTIQPDIELGQGLAGFGFNLPGTLGGSTNGALTNVLGTGNGLGGIGTNTPLIGGLLDSILPYNRNAFALLRAPALFDNQRLEGMSVAEYRRPTFAPRRDNQALSTETTYIKIQNDAGLVQEDPLTPLFGVLSVNGVRHKYDPDQAYEKEIPEKLREKGTYGVNAKFHLQLNSFKPDTNTGSISTELDNCTIGSLTGSTGPEAVPRVRFAWNWNDIAMNACDSDNPDYIYCDSTQFSIALLKKMQALREFTQTNATNFECPPLISGNPIVEQTLSPISNDIALIKLEYRKTGSDLNFSTTIASNNQREFQSTITTTIQKTDANGLPTETVLTCNSNARVLTRSTVSCAAPNLANGTYLVTSQLGTVTNCPNCENGSTTNDRIVQTVLVGLDNTVVKCDPVTTERLQDFIDATERAGKTVVYPQGLDKEKVLKLVSFRAHLIKDGLTTDFRNDFHAFALSKAFFQTPRYYSEEDGLGELFSNPTHVTFDYLNAPSGPLPEPGVYQVNVNAAFTDTSFTWFRSGEPEVNIIIQLEKTADASPASPFYYLPFDGTIGTDNGRNGYGLNYELLTADKPVRITPSSDQSVRVENIVGSNPVSTLKARLVDDITTINRLAKGRVLSIDRTANELSLAPSLATPVILKVNATTARDAYVFYSLESNGQPQTNVDNLAEWNGLGATCKDYWGNAMETYNQFPDRSGLNTNCAIVGSRANSAFGFEWCDKIKSGLVFLETVLYSPAKSTAVVRKVAASNEATLIGPAGEGNQVELTGASNSNRNSQSTPITTVEDVLNLVRSGQVCISGMDNALRTEFFWNPKPVMESIQSAREQASQSCISG